MEISGPFHLTVISDAALWDQEPFDHGTSAAPRTCQLHQIRNFLRATTIRKKNRTIYKYAEVSIASLPAWAEHPTIQQNTNSTECLYSRSSARNIDTQRLRTGLLRGNNLICKTKDPGAGRNNFSVNCRNELRPHPFPTGFNWKFEATHNQSGYLMSAVAMVARSLFS